jgi:hypothetical protein
MMRSLLIILCLVSVAACTTPVAVVKPPRPQPITCLQVSPDQLADLPAGFDGMSLEQQAKTILTLHAKDGTVYQQVLVQLHACQQFVKDAP